MTKCDCCPHLKKDIQSIIHYVKIIMKAIGAILIGIILNDIWADLSSIFTEIVKYYSNYQLSVATTSLIFISKILQNCVKVLKPKGWKWIF